MIQIEKGIPIPENKERKEHTMRFPFKYMEIGDSFEVDVTNYKDLRSLRSSLKAAENRYIDKFKLTYEFETHNTEKGIRIWRVK